ncbi:MAG TPA: phosphatase PAP2 family protein, partial [Gemmatimonadaceae bacterium]
MRSSCKTLDRIIALTTLVLGQALLRATPLAAQSAPPVSEPTHAKSLFTWNDAILGGTFIAGTFAIRPLDKSAADALQVPSRQQRVLFRRAATFVREIADPGSFLIGGSMYAVGRLTHEERLAEIGLHGTEALAIGAVAGEVLKDFFGRARPFVDSVPDPDNWQLMRGFKRGGNYQSFPSGHTTAAFAAAAAVSAETSKWYPGATYFLIGPVLYAGAAGVGLSRMYNNRHWASDVILGAAIGTFAGMKVVRYHSNHPNTGVDRLLLRADLSPSDFSHISFSILPS